MRDFRNWQNIKQNSQSIMRVLILSLPMAFSCIYLLLTEDMALLPALGIYAIAVLFIASVLHPISNELQTLRHYIYSLTDNQKLLQDNPHLEVKDTQELMKAINTFHRFWASKADTLEAKTKADAAVLDTLPDPLLLLDGEGNITSANRPARTFLGEDILSQNIDKVFSTNIFINSVAKVLKNETNSQSLVFHAPEYMNSRLYAHITKLPETSKSRAVAVISLYDISKAISLEKMQSDFVANASHELRTPLSIISGFIETLQTTAKDDDDARDSFLAIMKEQTEYMSSLIEDLLSLSKIEMAQDKEIKDKVDILEVIDDVTNALKFKALNHSVNVIVNSPEKLPKIVADNGQVHQILQNLLDNAIKYAVENSDVVIDLKNVAQIPAALHQNIAPGKAVSIAITNKGQKINKEDLSRLTEKFYRLQIHKDMKIKGTGLGLAIAKQIILHHRGNLTVTSTTYKGNTFTVYLPVKQK